MSTKSGGIVANFDYKFKRKTIFVQRCPVRFLRVTRRAILQVRFRTLSARLEPRPTSLSTVLVQKSRMCKILTGHY